MSKELIISQKSIGNRIYALRGEQVMLDRDLADLYQVDTKVLNQAVKRNLARFPEEFHFQLTDLEYEGLRSQIVTSSSGHGGRRTLPFAFTEQGVAMLSAVLRSDVAIRVSVQIMNAFVQMRRIIGQETIQHLRFSNIENKLIEHDQKFSQIFSALEQSELPQKGIFFDGQVFDAYNFVSDLIRKAKHSLILIDNYLDDSVFTLLNKRKKGVNCVCYTKTISKNLKLDLEKHNQQYPAISLTELKTAHDRFLIIDDKELYHIGASLKDLGKKWFGFSKMDVEVFSVLKQLTLGE
ncbi:MAG TPA: ORF6N domain-containing protein [Arachidicoccus sp.]|nr:ORF6N domain-containing protein [Arachidicoccus sp.]